jgi:hypothetical protein
LPAYSASEKLNWLIVPIVLIPLPDTTSAGMIGGLVQTFPNGLKGPKSQKGDNKPFGDSNSPDFEHTQP